MAKANAAREKLSTEVRDLLRSDALGAYERIVLAERKGVKLDPWLRQRKALGLVRIGAANDALEVLGALERETRGDDEETLGLIGRAHKELAFVTGSRRARAAHLVAAHESYARAYRRTGGYWTGINAATLGRLLGRDRESATCAREVLARLDDLGDRAPTSEMDSRYWRLATRAEALLALGRKDEALSAYRLARQALDGAWSDLAATRRNARLLVTHLRADWAPFDLALHVPPLAICVGHMIDGRGRGSRRFPPDCAPGVKEALARWIASRGVRFGVAGLACGTDLLFHEALREQDGVARAMLPYPADLFREDSVDSAAGPSWGKRFLEVLDAPGLRVGTASLHQFAADSAWFEYGNEFLEGMGRLWAQELDAPLVRVAVWDGRPGDGPGGTASMARMWRKQRVPFDRIDPRRPEEGAASFDARLPRGRGASTSGSDVLTVLFADATGFSKLTEAQLDLFNRHFAGTIARGARACARPPRLRETWGDGFFFAFDDVGAAGRFALDLRDRIAGTAWPRLGLPEGMAIRIGLHSGPAKVVKNPVTGRRSALGTHVSHGARIEPITPPGRVYASEPFAVLAAGAQTRGFRCTFVGRMEWAKNHGAQPTYHVDRE